jgi:hypothetical protein
MMYQVVQVVPRQDYTIHVYFANGAVKKYGVGHLVGRGLFKALEDVDWYMERCTVLNGTVAWDRSGRFDPKECIDLDPDTLYEEGTDVADPLQTSA